VKLQFKLLTLSLFLAGSASAQKLDTTYFDLEWKPVAKATGSYYRITKTVEENKLYAITDYYNSGEIQMTGTLAALNPEIKHGIFTWYKDGEKTQEFTFDLGKIKYKKFFGKVGMVPNLASTIDERNHPPEYPGGMKKLYAYIGKHFNYPNELINIRPKGRIVINFVIDKAGSITEAFVQESVHPLLDAEAIKVIEHMPKWKPGQQDGEVVRVMYSIPITMN